MVTGTGEIQNISMVIRVADLQGRSQDLARGQEFLFQIGKFACRMLPQEMFLNGAILVRFGVY